MNDKNISTKTCTVCQVEKEVLKNFNKKRSECKNCQKEKRRKYSITDRAIKLDMIKHARDRAIKNNLPFDITVEDISQLPEYCPVFKWIKLERSLDRATDNSYTLDRLDNSKGYTQGNVRVISNRANSCKRDMSLLEIQSLLEYMKGE